MTEYKVKKVMAIDDDEASIFILKRTLAEIGFCKEFVFANTVSSAIDMVKTMGKSNLPDFIFLDIEMNNESGFDFLKIYSELDPELTNNFSPRIYMLSSHLMDGNNHDLSKRFKFFGVSGQLQKPLDKEDVEEAWEELMDQ